MSTVFEQESFERAKKFRLSMSKFDFEFDSFVDLYENKIPRIIIKTPLFWLQWLVVLPSIETNGTFFMSNPSF